MNRGTLAVMRIVAFVLGLYLALTSPADACGYWKLTDTAKGYDVGFLVNAGTITKRKRRLASLYLDTDAKTGLRVVRDKQVVFDIKGDTLVKRGKVIATIAGNAITFGKTTYTVELTNRRDEHEQPTWTLAVKADDKLVLESAAASSLCARPDQPRTDAEHEDDVRRRVFYYLAWRETGA